MLGLFWGRGGSHRACNVRGPPRGPLYSTSMAPAPTTPSLVTLPPSPNANTQKQSKIKQHPPKLLAEMVSGQHAVSDMMGSGARRRGIGGRGTVFLCSWCPLWQLHSTVARAESPQSSLPVWPLCPCSWGWAHPASGVGVRGTWTQVTCVMVFPPGSGSHLHHRCGAPLRVPPPRHRGAPSSTNVPSGVSCPRHSAAE